MVIIILIIIIIIIKKQPQLSFFYSFEDRISPETSGPAENLTTATVISQLIKSNMYTEMLSCEWVNATLSLCRLNHLN